MRMIHTIATLSTLVAVAVAPSAVSAQTIYVSGPGGSNQSAVESLFAAFRSHTGADVVYVPGSSNEIVAKLLAQEGKQELSLVLLDSGPMTRAVGLNLCDRLPDVPVLKDVYPAAFMDGGASVGFGFYATGLAYNKSVFAEHGWPAPTSWNDLGDPKFADRVVIGPIAGYGVEALVMVSRANGGDDHNIEPGFQFMANHIAPNVLAWEGSNANLAQMLQSGEAALAVWANHRTHAVIEQGAPVEFAFPKEGARQGMSSLCVVSGAPNSELAAKFVEEMLSPEGQAELSRLGGWGPVNSTVELPTELADHVIYGPEQVTSLVPVDWNRINMALPEWTERWNREIER